VRDSAHAARTSKMRDMSYHICFVIKETGRWANKYVIFVIFLREQVDGQISFTTDRKVHRQKMKEKKTYI